MHWVQIIVFLSSSSIYEITIGRLQFKQLLPHGRLKEYGRICHILAAISNRPLESLSEKLVVLCVGRKQKAKFSAHSLFLNNT